MDRDHGCLAGCKFTAWTNGTVGAEPAVGAMGLRVDLFMATVNQCQVDQELVEAKFGDDTFFEQAEQRVWCDASGIFIRGQYRQCLSTATL